MTVVSTALLAALAVRIPGLTLANALGIMEDVERYGYVLADAPDLTTHNGRVSICRTNTAIVAAISGQKKIQAIKELRNLAACGLKEAKDAVDVVYAEVNPTPAYPTPARAYDYNSPYRDSYDYDEQPF